MVKKIGEVGQEKGWYGGARSPRVQDLRLTPRQLEQIRHRKGMERITKPGSNTFRLPKHLLQPTISGPLSLNSQVSSWTPDLTKEGGWAGSYEYNPGTQESVRRLYGEGNPAPGRFIEIEGLRPDPEVKVLDAETVKPDEGIMPAWTTGSDLPRGFRSRMPEFREAFRLQQMQAVAANPFGNPFIVTSGPIPGGIPGGFTETPGTDISKKMQSNLGRRKGAPRPYLPGRTRMPFEIP
jgi:hypothetical protein